MEEDEAMSDAEMGEDNDQEEATSNGEQKAYVPGVSRNLKEGEELEFDPDAYKLFHSFETSMPCLSFDIARDNLGERRDELPAVCYIVAGTQAEKARENELFIMGLKNLRGMKPEESDSEEEEDDEEETKEDEKPVLHAVAIPHHGGINRLRMARLGDSHVCAVWNDQRKVQLWNLTGALADSAAMTGETKKTKLLSEKPLFSFDGHRQEGFALAWSNVVKGKLASGDCARGLHIWNMREGGQWVVDSKPLPGHTKSIEDLQWSPSESALLMSCSADASLRMWDTRCTGKEANVCTVEHAHASDVNVLSWNTLDDYIVSGGDDACLNIWSLKTIQYGEPVARFKQHQAPITSVEWHPHDSTTFIATGEDDQSSIWDIATEADAAGEGHEEIAGVPPQLMFLHLGQKEVKEVHWHPQIPGLAITTALTGFNVFKTINS